MEVNTVAAEAKHYGHRDSEKITSPETQEVIALLLLGFNKTLKSGW